MKNNLFFSWALFVVFCRQTLHSSARMQDLECTFDYNGERLVGTFRGFDGDRATIVSDELYTSLPSTDILFDTQELEDAKMFYLAAYKAARKAFDAEMAELHSNYPPETTGEEALALHNAKLPLITAFQAKLAEFIKTFAKIAHGF